MIGLAKAQVVEQLQTPKAWLISNGFYRGSNMCGREMQGLARRMNGTDWSKRGRTTKFCSDCHTVHSMIDLWNMADTGSGWEPLSWEQLPHYALYANTGHTFAGKYQDKPGDHDRGGVICTYKHEVGPDATGINMDLNLLNSTAKWVKDQEIADKLEVIPITQLLRRRLMRSDSTMCERSALAHVGYSVSGTIRKIHDETGA